MRRGCKIDALGLPMRFLHASGDDMNKFFAIVLCVAIPMSVFASDNG